MSQKHFSVPIAPIGRHASGTIECTEPHPNVYLLTWTAPPENRLTIPFLNALLTALDAIEFGDFEPGVVVTTSGIPKFYSNGLDLDLARQDESFWVLLYKTFARFLTFPMPTVALIQGHSFAGGLFLAMSHDYRLGPSEKGWIRVNELDFGAPLPAPVAAVLRTQISRLEFRKAVLESYRYTGKEAFAAGLVDGVAASFDDVLKLIHDRKLLIKAKSPSYGHIKAEMYVDLLPELAPEAAERAMQKIRALYREAGEREEKGRAWYERWVVENKVKPKI